MPLTAAQTKLVRLAPDKISGEATFLIDAAQSITVQITATADVDVTIEIPSGDVFNGNNIDTIDGSFVTFETQETDDSPLILFAGSGFHYLFVFPSQGEGVYTVHFAAAHSLEGEIAIASIVLTNSPIGTALVASRPFVELGGFQVVSAFVFDRGIPVVGANVTARVRSQDDTLHNLQLQDDGTDGDDLAGDGIYSALIEPSEVGRHAVVVRIDGTSLDGTPFFRENTAEFHVLAPNSRIVRVVDDRAVDDDGDGVFNRIAIFVETDTETSGRYEMFLKLGGSGKTVVRRSEFDLIEGLQTRAVTFEGEAIIGLNENGPFDIVLLRLDLIADDQTFIADSFVDRVQTRPYLLSQFEPSIPGSIEGTVTDEQTNEGLLGVLLRIHDVNGDFLMERATDASGHYEFNDLNPGSYFLFTQNTSDFVDEIYLDIPCIGACDSPDEEGIPVAVITGLATTSVDFALSR